MKWALAFALFSLVSIPVDSAAQSESITFRGQCSRGDRTGNATLILRAEFGSDEVTGTLNGRNISDVRFDTNSDEISFDTPGIFQDQDVIRHFDGRLTENGIVGTLSQDDGRQADCKLRLQG